MIYTYTFTYSVIYIYIYRINLWTAAVSLFESSSAQLNPAILKYISRHCIDQLHSTHHPDYTMLYNLTSSRTEVPTFHSSNTNLVYRNTDKSPPVAVKLNPAAQLTYHLIL